MRFPADMGVAGRLAEWLRGEGHDVVHVRDTGMQRTADREILAKAADEDRIVLTFDLDFGELLARSGDRIPSVVLFRLNDTTTPRVRDRLAAVLRRASADLATGAIVVVEEARLRVRQLPIGS